MASGFRRDTWDRMMVKVSKEYIGVISDPLSLRGRLIPGRRRLLPAPGSLCPPIHHALPRSWPRICCPGPRNR